MGQMLSLGEELGCSELIEASKVLSPSRFHPPPFPPPFPPLSLPPSLPPFFPPSFPPALSSTSLAGLVLCDLYRVRSRHAYICCKGPAEPLCRAQGIAYLPSIPSILLTYMAMP